MKKLFFIASIFFFLIGFIIALQNIALTSSVQMFFEAKSGSLFGILFFCLFVGMVSGVFLGMAFMIKKEKPAVDIESL